MDREDRKEDYWKKWLTIIKNMYLKITSCSQIVICKNMKAKNNKFLKSFFTIADNVFLV